ncbi:phage minor tail protein L [Edwardsiella tarda]|uniref:phage minor tail protein L n=1 Tax=Edwardsiella tarda TaxID=636 RepID=UPI0018E07C59|nr:phage minor tail protein L [Edwardsiella tarda]
MQQIPQATCNELTQVALSAKIDLWEFDLTAIGGECYFFCNQVNAKGEPITWQGRQYQCYPVECGGVEMKGKGVSNRPTLALSNLFGLVTGMAEDLQSLVGAKVIRRQVYTRFLDAVNFPHGNPDADPEQEAVAHYIVEQLSQLTNETATFVLASPVETDGALFPGRIMLADTCAWVYRSDECGYVGPPVADEFDQPTTDPLRDKCSRCRRGCELRHNVSRAGFFASINKLSR